MKDIFSTSFDSDYHFLGFSKSELEMAAPVVARLMRKSELTRKVTFKD